MSHVDITKVEAELARAKQALLPLTKDPGSRGAQARFSLTVDTAFSRQLAEEINRGTPTEFVSDALAAVCANMISSLVESVAGDGTPNAEFIADINHQLMKTTRCLMLRIQGKSEEVFQSNVPVEEGGNA